MFPCFYAVRKSVYLFPWHWRTSSPIFTGPKALANLGTPTVKAIDIVKFIHVVKSNVVLDLIHMANVLLLICVVIGWLVLTLSCRQTKFCWSRPKAWPWVMAIEISFSIFFQACTFFDGHKYLKFSCKVSEAKRKSHYGGRGCARGNKLKSPRILLKKWSGFWSPLSDSVIRMCRMLLDHSRLRLLWLTCYPYFNINCILK